MIYTYIHFFSTRDVTANLQPPINDGIQKKKTTGRGRQRVAATMLSGREGELATRLREAAASGQTKVFFSKTINRLSDFSKLPQICL